MTPQLHIDFDTSTERIARPSMVKEHSKVVFHEDASLIEGTRFALKLSYKSRSYLVRGVYHITNTSHFRDDTISRVVDYVQIEQIATFRNGQYIQMPILKSEEAELTLAAKDILANPYNNPFLTLRFDRGTFA